VDGIVVYNGISPNGNGKNDYVHLEYIQYFHNIQMTIYDRWQNVVWTGKDYDNTSVRFEGKNSAGKQLPAGTYYYVLTYYDNDNKLKTQKGYIYLVW